MTKGTPSYAKHKKTPGYTLGQYEADVIFCNIIADNIFDEAHKRHRMGTGMYYPTSELDNDFMGMTDEADRCYVMYCLKNRGMEFIEDGAMYRI